MMGATAIAIYNVLFLYGLTMAPASDGAIIVPGLAPVFTVLCAWLVLQERIGWREAAGFAVAFGGPDFLAGAGVRSWVAPGPPDGIHPAEGDDESGRLPPSDPLL